MRRYYFLILLVLVSPIFFIKSSNISLSVNYPGLLVESNNAVVINNTAYSFSNKFNLNADAFGYKKSFFEKLLFSFITIQSYHYKARARAPPHAPWAFYVRKKSRASIQSLSNFFYVVVLLKCIKRDQFLFV